MNSIKVFSFDLDGTLVDKKFADLVWLRGIPEAYASKNGIELDEAIRIVKREYDKIGVEAIEWYEIDYWLRKFDLDIDKEELFDKYQHEIRVYPEVEGVLKKLKKNYRLIISSNAARVFIDREISSIRHYFSHIFSAVSDFKKVKKANDFYRKICEILEIKPEEMVHVGDHWYFDFVYPREEGINAFYLDRKGVLPRDDCSFIINNLEELLSILSI